MSHSEDESTTPSRHNDLCAKNCWRSWIYRETLTPCYGTPIPLRLVQPDGRSSSRGTPTAGDDDRHPVCVFQPNDWVEGNRELKVAAEQFLGLTSSQLNGSRKVSVDAAAIWRAVSMTASQEGSGQPILPAAPPASFETPPTGIHPSPQLLAAPSNRTSDADSQSS